MIYTHLERRQRLDNLARRGGSPAEVDDPITNSEGDGHGRAGLEDFRRRCRGAAARIQTNVGEDVALLERPLADDGLDAGDEGRDVF